MKLREWLKQNKVFFVLAAAVLIALLSNVFFQYLGKNPFASQEILDTPVQVYAGAERFYYISEASSVISVTDAKHRLLYQIAGGNAEKSFETAAAVVEGRDGALYVHDTISNENGIGTSAERILRFSSSGKLEEVLYEVEAYNRSNQRAASLGGLCVLENSLLFAKIEDNGVSLLEITDSGIRDRAFMPFQGSSVEGCIEVTDCAVRGDLETSISLMNGSVLTWRDGGWVCVYNARKHDTRDFFSIISEIAYGGQDGLLYLCDIGQRKICKISTEKTNNLEIRTVIARNQFLQQRPDSFAEMPLYTGMSVSNGIVSVLSTEYTYDQASDEEIFFYRLAAVYEEGGTAFYSDSLNLSLRQRICRCMAYVTVLLLAVMAFFWGKTALKVLQTIQIERNVKIQLVMVATALAVTLGISYMIFQNSNARFVDAATSNLGNVAYRIAQNMDLRLLEAVNTPEAFGNLAYHFFDEDINDILNKTVNEDSDMYCVVYKVKNDCVCEAYQSDKNRSLMYPLAGVYSGGIEEQIAAENSYDIIDSFSLTDGSYMYALVPVYDAAGNAVAFVEVGTDYARFDQENNDLYVRVLMLAVMGVIIIMLLLSELLCSMRAVQELHGSRRLGASCPPDVIRPLSFLYFLVANFSTAFLPIYGTHLWNDRFPLQVELAAALPLTAEMVTAAVAAFLCGFLVKRAGIRLVCLAGGTFYIAGCLLSAFAGNLWILIGANGLCGAGSGCLTLGLNAWAAGYEEEEQQNKGFIHINAAYLAGLNCGTVIGSMVWENFGMQTAFFASAACALLLVLLCAIMIGDVPASEEEEEEEEGSGSLRDLFTPAVIRYFLCISVPYLTCTAFLEYFFPLEAEANGLSATHISMAFMLSGLISIYAGSSLAEPITERLGTKAAMLLASFLYAAALFYLVINPTVMSCYVVVVLFAAADSFGLSAQSVYFSALPEVKKTGQSKALGVNSTVESAVSACGSLIFGAALMLGTRRGILLIASVFTILTVSFVISDRAASRKRSLVLASGGYGPDTAEGTGGSLTTLSPSGIFPDVEPESPYYGAISFMQESGLMHGCSRGSFNPNAPMSRGMMTQVLYNREGCPAVAAGGRFLDISKRKWYAHAVAWAEAEEVISDYSGRWFRPNKPVTREQLAVILWRYAGKPIINRELHFQDAGKVDRHALDAMRWAAARGLLPGTENGTLNPGRTATRAEAAQIFQNFFQT